MIRGSRRARLSLEALEVREVLSGNPTTTALMAWINPTIIYGQQETLTASVYAANGTPTGSVTFCDGSTALATVGLSQNLLVSDAVFSTSTLALGDHSFSAAYHGDDNFDDSSSAPLSVTVEQATTSTFLSSSNNPSDAGQPVTFTAAVSSMMYYGAMPTGTVTFHDGTANLGTGNLDSTGAATFTTSTLAVGDHHITADYSGDPTYAASTSWSLTETVQKATTSTTLSANINPSTLGQTVTFTASVTGSGLDSMPTGSVTFYNGGMALGSGTLNSSGQATFSTATLPAGDDSITAEYNGDQNFATSTSSSLNETVQQAATLTTLTSDVNPSVVGQTVTFTATVSSSYAGASPSGMVTFYDDSMSIGSSTLDNSGHATFAIDTMEVGDHPITAEYSGDQNFLTSTSAALIQAVQKAASSVDVTPDINPIFIGQTVTFTATVNGSVAGKVPTGTVTFIDNGLPLSQPIALDNTGKATFAINTLAAGAHTIAASYGGDQNYLGSISKGLLEVVQPKTGTSLLLNANLDPAGLGQTVKFTATVLWGGRSDPPTGSVTFSDGSTTLGVVALDSSGQAALSTAFLTTGTHVITAVYSGDRLFESSAAQLLESVVQTRSWIVNTLDDSDANPANLAGDTAEDANGNVSLRSAIQQANFDGANGVTTPFVINFEPGLSGTITELRTMDGLGFNITINGPGATTIVVAGPGTTHQANFPVFTVDAGTSCTISGLTITKGDGANGGGIVNSGSLVVADCSITSNVADNGGGIYNAGGTLAVAGCSIMSNTAANGSGGGIYNAGGTVTVYGSSLVWGNSAEKNGGGIYSAGTLTIYGGTLIGTNQAGIEGGGIWASGTLHVSGGEISYNDAGQRGGGVYFVGVTASFDSGNSIQNNVADTGGGAYLNAGNITWTSCTVLNNTARRTIPGVAFLAGATVSQAGGAGDYQSFVQDGG